MMQAETTKAIEVFYSYAHQDELLRIELEKHLSILKRQGFIATWHSRKITVGVEWAHGIDAHLNTSQIILLLVSPDFIASDYCYDIEVKKALERHEVGEARVIPIILRPIEWEYMPFSKLQALPTNKKPVVSWSGRAGRDNAFQDIAKGIRAVVKELQSSIAEPPFLFEFNFRLVQSGVEPHAQKHTESAAKKAIYYWLHESHKFYGLQQYTEAIHALDQIIQIDPKAIPIYISKYNMLFRLKQYEEVLKVCKQVISLDPNHTSTYKVQGNTLFELKRYEEALVSYEEAIRIFDTHFNHPHLDAYEGKGFVLERLGKIEEARRIFEKALVYYKRSIRVNPKNVKSHNGKGKMLYKLKRYEEALDAYEHSISLETDNPVAYHGKRLVLERLGRVEEAQQAFEKADQLRYYNESYEVF